MIYSLTVDNETIISKYHRPIKNRILKEISKGNRNFQEFNISDVEFLTLFDNDFDRFKEYLKFRSRKKVERCFIP